MNIINFISKKYLSIKNRAGFLSFLTILSFLGIVFSVSAFLVIHSVMNGFSIELKEKVIGIESMASIQGGHQSQFEEIKLRLAGLDPKLRLEKNIDFDGILSIHSSVNKGSKIRGITESFCENNPQMNIYFFPEEDCRSFIEEGGILIGEELFYHLNLIYGFAQEIKVIFPFSDINPNGEFEPSIKELKLMGVFSSGYYKLDQFYSFISYQDAQLLTRNQDQYQEIKIFLNEEKKALEIVTRLESLIPKDHIHLWRDKNIRLFEALQLERIGMILLLSIVSFISMFNIISLISLLAKRKQREIAILMVMGLSKKSSFKIFTQLGFKLGLLGMIVGIAIGLSIVLFINYYPLYLPSAYYLEYLPVKLDYFVLIGLIMVTPVLSFLASIISIMNLKVKHPQRFI